MKVKKQLIPLNDSFFRFHAKSNFFWYKHRTPMMKRYGFIFSSGPHMVSSLSIYSPTIRFFYPGKKKASEIKSIFFPKKLRLTSSVYNIIDPMKSILFDRPNLIK